MGLLKKHKADDSVQEEIDNLKERQSKIERRVDRLERERKVLIARKS